MTTAATPSAFPQLTRVSNPVCTTVVPAESDDDAPLAPYYPVALRPATDAELADAEQFLATLARGRSTGKCERIISVLLGDAAYRRASEREATT